MSRANGWIHWVFAAGVFFAAATAGATAAAKGPPDGDEPCPPATERHWYGWQTLVTDGAGLGLVAVGSAMQDQHAEAGLVSVGLASFILGGPIVHLAHGRWATGVLDLGLRLTLPIVGAYMMSSCTQSDCGVAVVPGAVIALSPVLIDARLLAWENVPRESGRGTLERRPPRMLARLGVTELHPTTHFTRRGLELGLGGTF